jgi:hypothetical protein
MREPAAEVVRRATCEDLRLPGQASKRPGLHHAIAITLEGETIVTRRRRIRTHS